MEQLPSLVHEDLSIRRRAPDAAWEHQRGAPQNPADHQSTPLRHHGSLARLNHSELGCQAISGASGRAVPEAHQGDGMAAWSGEASLQRPRRRCIRHFGLIWVYRFYSTSPSCVRQAGPRKLQVVGGRVPPHSAEDGSKEPCNPFAPQAAST